MKKRKMLKRIILFSGFFLFLVVGLLFVMILISGEEEENSGSSPGNAGLNVSEEVMKYQELVIKYANEYGIPEYINHLLAIMQVESGGKVDDVMQSSESAGLPPNTLQPEESVKQGCMYFAGLLKTAEEKECDFDTALQSYNYGGSYINHVAANGKKHTLDLAEQFAWNKSGGTKVPYSDPIAVQMNGGWRYKYGNMFYVLLVNQYLFVPEFDNATVQAIFTEALKYQGWEYNFGGDNPNTSFDCSGLVKWCFGVAGIQMPRTAQEQYNSTQHIPLEEARPGDLIFFQGTYDSGTQITHVGIYAGANQMYHAGNPIGYADITTAYWQKHFVSAGRVKR